MIVARSPSSATKSFDVTKPGMALPSRYVASARRPYSSLTPSRSRDLNTMTIMRAE